MDLLISSLLYGNDVYLPMSEPISEWYYLRLALLPDPELKASLPSLYSQLNVDILTWRSIISSALYDFYGIIGQARHFDILAQLSAPSLVSIIRIHKDDKDVFKTSISNLSFALSDYFGSEYPMNGRVVVDSHLAFLGMLPL